MAEPERCGEVFWGPPTASPRVVRCERPAGHEPPAPEGCGPAERCEALYEPLASGRRLVCGNPLPCDEHPVHGPENAGGGAGQFNPAGPASGSAPARPPADDDLAGLAHDLCAAMEAGADPEGLRGLLVARGWRPPGEARPIDRDALRARVAVIIASAWSSTFEKADAVLDLLAQEGDHGTT